MKYFVFGVRGTLLGHIIADKITGKDISRFAEAEHCEPANLHTVSEIDFVKGLESDIKKIGIVDMSNYLSDLSRTGGRYGYGVEYINSGEKGWCMYYRATCGCCHVCGTVGDCDCAEADHDSYSYISTDELIKAIERATAQEDGVVYFRKRNKEVKKWK